MPPTCCTRCCACCPASSTAEPPATWSAPQSWGRGTLPEPRPQAWGVSHRRVRVAGCAAASRAHLEESASCRSDTRGGRFQGSAEANGETTPGTDVDAIAVVQRCRQARFHCFGRLGRITAGGHHVRAVGRGEIEQGQIVAVADELGVPARHSRVAVECDLGMDVARLAGPADQRGALCQRDGRRRPPI